MYNLCSENKGTDQLRGHREADLRLFFAFAKTGFLICAIVAKFHYFKEREAVRSKSFELSDKLKAENVGVGAQSPKKMRGTRKNLYDIMQQEKAKGNTVKLMRDKLYVNGHFYQPGSTLAATTAPAAATGP